MASKLDEIRRWSEDSRLEIREGLDSRTSYMVIPRDAVSWLLTRVDELSEALRPVKALRDELRNQYIETYDIRHAETTKYSAIVTKGTLEAAHEALEKLAEASDD